MSRKSFLFYKRGGFPMNLYLGDDEIEYIEKEKIDV